MIYPRSNTHTIPCHHQPLICPRFKGHHSYSSRNTSREQLRRGSSLCRPSRAETSLISPRSTRLALPTGSTSQGGHSQIPWPEAVSPVTVHLQLPPAMRHIHSVFHVSHVKPVIFSARLPAPTSPPPPWLLDDGVAYTVRKLLQVHRRRCVVAPVLSDQLDFFTVFFFSFDFGLDYSNKTCSAILSNSACSVPWHYIVSCIVYNKVFSKCVNMRLASVSGKGSCIVIFDSASLSCLWNFIISQFIANLYLNLTLILLSYQYCLGNGH